MEKAEERSEELIDVQIVEGELVAESSDRMEAPDEETTKISPRREKAIADSQKTKTADQARSSQSAIRNYWLLPFLFLTVALLGGLRLSAESNAFIFWRPPLFCLIAAALLLVLFARARLIRLEGWFSEDFTTLQNMANGAVLISLFAASTQIFNALLPEQGLPFWVFAFCFFWTLWNNLFADFDTRKLLRSLGALFGLAFVVKYLILANLVAPQRSGLWESLMNLPKEAVTWLLDLPRFSTGTGYIQFFTVVFYLIGLFLLPQNSSRNHAEPIPEAGSLTR